MKRVRAACICQTLCFLPKDDTGQEETARSMREEVAAYKAGLEKSRTRYRIVEETEQPDGSIVVKIIKQYNQNDVGDYLN